MFYVALERPIRIEAVKWTGSNHREMFDFLTYNEHRNDRVTGYGDSFYIDHDKVRGGLILKTFVGDSYVQIGDYVVKGGPEEFYPCKPDHFERTYKEVGNP